MNYPILLICAAVIFLTVGCKEKPSENTGTTSGNTLVAGSKEKTEQQKPVPFTPPADSAISVDQMMAWSTCNPLLDSLTFRYADSFKTEDPAALLRYQEDFITAQDRICVRAGLPGGYHEYKWVLQNMGLDKNRAILESAHAQSF
ncbi:MAG: hypothetical protein JW863_19055 [Chitinispirillaceae bacterium]|nr:hypothetical protein [Chitinispirillaceae bacterium]